MTTNDGPGVPPERAPETTSVFRADFLTEAEPPAREQSVSGVDALPAGSALLVVKRGPNAGSRFLLDRSTTSAGRHPDSDIFLDDVTVSRRHAEFVRGDGAGGPGPFRVRDVGSLNGTYVDRERIDDRALRTGDEVQIGKFRMVFHASRRAGAPPAGGPTP